MTGSRANSEAANDLLAGLDRELWLVTARDGPRRGGLIATFVGSASIVAEAPRLTVGLAKQHYTRGLVEAVGAMALHLLAEEHLPWVWRFGLRSGRDGDKLDGLPARDGVTGSPVLEGVVGWLEGRVESKLDTGDRTVYLLDVVAGGRERDHPPLTLKRMLQLAGPEHLALLKEGMARDAAVDAAAITAWRGERQGDGRP